MKIFRMIPNWDHNRVFQINRFPQRDPFGNAMHADEALLERWQATRINFSLWKDALSDIVETGWTYANFGVNARAAEALRPWLPDSCELLPFTHQGVDYWVLYVRGVNCLNHRQSIFNSIDENMREILIASFDPEKMPLHHILRVARGSDYFITENLKHHIEQVQLTGVRFQFMWSDDGSEPDEPTIPAAKPKRRRKKPAQESATNTPRELLLKRLWNDVILPHGDPDLLERTLAIARFNAHNGGPTHNDSSTIIRRLVRVGVDKAEILALLRAIAYDVVFETLVLFEEEGLDDSPEFASLHEDLLIAEPD